MAGTAGLRDVPPLRLWDVETCVSQYIYKALASYPPSLRFPIMHPLHNCHHIKLCHLPVKQYITTHHNFLLSWIHHVSCHVLTCRHFAHNLYTPQWSQGSTWRSIKYLDFALVFGIFRLDTKIARVNWNANAIYSPQYEHYQHRFQWHVSIHYLPKCWRCNYWQTLPFGIYHENIESRPIQIMI